MAGVTGADIYSVYRMRVLALDTTTLAGSVALVIDDRIVEERAGDAARPHAARLPGDLVAVASAHGLTLADIDLFAVASGPGSYTGMRIGIATAQGAAFVHDRMAMAVSALEAMAHVGSAALAPGAIVAPWMDAHRREVFAALYRVTGAPLLDPARLALVEEPTAGDPEGTLARWNGLGTPPDLFVGQGAILYRAIIGDAKIVDTPMLAGAIGCLASARARRGEAVRPAALQPLYVRRPDVEIARDKRGL
jgi:tRNA threonylcarbamoyladenosine biosynthesis protein TsaB